MTTNDIQRQFNINQDEHKLFMNKLDKIEESQTEIKVVLASLPEQLADKFDKRYASKEYEESLKRINWMVISAVIIALLGLIIK